MWFAYTFIKFSYWSLWKSVMDRLKNGPHKPCLLVSVLWLNPSPWIRWDLWPAIHQWSEAKVTPCTLFKSIAPILSESFFLLLETLFLFPFLSLFFLGLKKQVAMNPLAPRYQTLPTTLQVSKWTFCNWLSALADTLIAAL